MKKLLLSTCMFLYVLSIQAKPTPNDSIKAQQDLIMKRIDYLYNDLALLKKTKDSLNKDLTYYHAKDDFYVMAVDRQGSHFEWLLATMIGVAGFISYNIFQREKKKLRKEIAAVKADATAQLSKANKTTEQLKGESERLKFRLYTTLGLVLNDIIASVTPQADDYETNERALGVIIRSLQYGADAYLLESVEGININPLQRIYPKDILHISIENINKALDNLDNIINNDADHEQKRKRINELKEAYSDVPDILIKYKLFITHEFDADMATLRNRFDNLLTLEV
ncbi:hypothetical protein [Spirosoma luteum]|uniref:hypothetical protein n=1 Tax=Spirosoma luteum TaxID=431553 RepID=UPI000370A7A3|nr:hypothetical protein [Spirosoma luteum]